MPLPTGGKGELPDVAHQDYVYPRLVGGRQVGHLLPMTEVGQNHPFHLVDLSPWPKAMAGALLPLMGGTVLAMSNTVGGGTLMLCAVLQVTWIFQRWLNDVVAEGAYMGNHTMRVVNNLVTGFSLFILSEVMLFFSIFWAFLHSSLSPSVELGSMWPPLGIEPLEAGLIPTLNTVLLVSSGASVTWAHHALLAGQRASALNGMAITLAFSAVFTGQ
jgi:cytochrome c oxidase subunit 3